MAGSQIGDNLAAARDNAGLSQPKAAKALEVHEQTLSKYERGVIQKVPLRVLERAAVAYGVRLEQLTAGVIQKGESPPSRMVSRGTHAAIDAQILAFEREAARLGANDPELDHIHHVLHHAKESRLFYLGADGAILTPEQQAVEMGYQIDGMRLWLETHMAQRGVPKRRTRSP